MIKEYWFPNENYQYFWFSKDKDLEIYKKFNYLLEDYKDKELKTYDEFLETIILLDQFSRNINRIKKIDIEYFHKKAYIIAEEFIKKYKTKLYENINHFVFVLLVFRHNNTIEDYDYVFKHLDILQYFYKDNKIYKKFYNVSIAKYKKLI